MENQYPYLAQYWMCALCGYETFNPQDKESHMLTNENDPDHDEIIPIHENEIVFELEESEENEPREMYA